MQKRGICLERIDLGFKGVLLFFGTLFSMLVEGFGVVFTILIITMIADYNTGILASHVEGGWRAIKSSRATQGFIKKVYVLILIGIIYLIEINLFGSRHLGNGISLTFISIEFISITENGARMKAPVPSKVLEFIQLIKGKGDKK